MAVLFDRANLFPAFFFITVQSVQYGGLAQALLPLALFMNLISFFLYGIDSSFRLSWAGRPELLLGCSCFAIKPGNGNSGFWCRQRVFYGLC